MAKTFDICSSFASYINGKAIVKVPVLKIDYGRSLDEIVEANSDSVESVIQKIKASLDEHGARVKAAIEMVCGAAYCSFVQRRFHCSTKLQGDK